MASAATTRHAIRTRPRGAVPLPWALGLQTVTEEPARGARDPLRTYGPLLALVLLAIAISIVVRHSVFPAFSWNRDEPIYLWQSDLLRAGQLFSPDGGTPGFLQPWLTGHSGQGFFSQYTPGWPLVLALTGAIFGTPDVAIALATALAVVGVYVLAREVTRRHDVALVAAAITTLSPVLVIQSGMYLGYLFSLGLGCLFGAAMLAGVRRARPVLLVAAGLLLGAIFLTRPFDAVLWAIPFTGFVVVTHRDQVRTVVRTGLWTAVGFAPLVAVQLLYNRKITGSFASFPITAADPLDKFLFGVRRIMPKWTPVDFTVARAFRGTGRNLFYLPQFLLGSFLGVVVAAAGAWIGRRRSSTWLLVALGTVFPLGYFLFWGIYLSGAKVSLSGPLYYVPLFAPLSILMAVALVELWQRRRAATLVLGTALVLISVPYLVDKLDANHSISQDQARWRDSASGIRPRALLFVEPSGPYLVQLNPFSTNGTDLDGHLLYAVDRGPGNLRMIAAHPDRAPYLQSKLPEPDGSGARSTITVTKLHVVSGSTVTVHARLTNRTASPTVVAYAQIAGTTVTHTLDTTSHEGATYDVDWVVRSGGLLGDGSNELTAPPGAFTLAIGFGAGTSGDVALAARRLEQQFGARSVVRDGHPVIDVVAPGRGVRQRVTPRVIVSTRVETAGVLTVVPTPRG